MALLYCLLHIEASHTSGRKQLALVYAVHALTSCSDCRLCEQLGSGQFGVVYKGVWISPDGDVDVAVKTLKEGSGEEDRVKFLQEATIMGQFKHHNVVEMYGVVTEGEPVSLYDNTFVCVYLACTVRAQAHRLFLALLQFQWCLL